MVNKKYAADYRLENVVDRSGRLKTVPVYRGVYYRFAAGEAELRRGKRRSTILLSAASGALLLTLLIPSSLLQRIYAVMPLILCLLPAVLLWTSLYAALTAGEKVNREQRDRICDRLAAWSMVLAILAAVSLVGQIAAYIAGAGAEGIPVTVLTVVAAAAALCLHLGREDLRMEEIPGQVQANASSV
jgi:hypothetical protein